MHMGFEKLHLSQDLIKAVNRKGFVEPTTIQERCIPEIKAGHDVVAQSLTGSGKTAAFGLPILEKVLPGKGVQALILAPTRELAEQVKVTLESFSYFMKISITAVYGGMGMQPQVDALKRADIVVATPGRMLDHIRRNTVKLGSVNFLVIDEADKMFEMGFIEDLKEILSYLPKKRQTLLFSATMPAEIHRLIRMHLTTPVNIKEQLHVDKSLLKQVYYDVKPHEKFSLLVHLLKHKTSGLAIVFCRTRREVDTITKNLKLQKLHVMAVHGGLSQNRRLYAVESLKTENIQVLVATDVAARGLDINNISHIYNYDSAKTPNEYTHRIGRTARAGKSGEAVTILSERDHDDFRNVMSDRSLHIQKEELPSFEKVHFMRDMQRTRQNFSRHSGGSEHSSRFSRPHSQHRGFKPRFSHSR